MRPLFLVVVLLACRQPPPDSSDRSPAAGPPPAQAGTPDAPAVPPLPPTASVPAAPPAKPSPQPEASPEGAAGAGSGAGADRRGSGEQGRKAPPSVCSPAADRLCPVDEAGSDPALHAFRGKLREAVRKKSEAKLLPLVAENIRVSFGGDNGIEAFRKRWRPSSPDSPLWQELGEVLSLGGSFRDDDRRTTFWAPYVYARWPSRLDPFLSMAVVRAGVPLRESPSASARTIETLDWAIVDRVLQSARKDAEWVEVRVPKGKRGWVRASDVRSSVDWRAGLRNDGKGWKLTVFVSGD